MRSWCIGLVRRAKALMDFFYEKLRVFLKKSYPDSTDASSFAMLLLGFLQELLQLELGLLLLVGFCGACRRASP